MAIQNYARETKNIYHIVHMNFHQVYISLYNTSLWEWLLSRTWARNLGIRDSNDDTGGLVTPFWHFKPSSSFCTFTVNAIPWRGTHLHINLNLSLFLTTSSNQPLIGWLAGRRTVLTGSLPYLELFNLPSLLWRFWLTCSFNWLPNVPFFLPNVPATVSSRLSSNGKGLRATLLSLLLLSQESCGFLGWRWPCSLRENKKWRPQC